MTVCVCVKVNECRRKRYIFAAGVAIILLSGCSGSGLGMPGSPAWSATTPQAEQATYFPEIDSSGPLASPSSRA